MTSTLSKRLCAIAISIVFAAFLGNSCLVSAANADPSNTEGSDRAFSTEVTSGEETTETKSLPTQTASDVAGVVSTTSTSDEGEGSSSSDNVEADTSGLSDDTSDNPVGEVYLVVAPSFSWEDIDNDNTPNLQRLAGRYACANVIAEDKVDVYALDANPRFHYVRVNSTKAREIDLRVAEIYEKLGPNDSLFITSSPYLARIDAYALPGYGALIMVDAGDNGLLTSTSTHRSGLVTSSNVSNAIAHLLEAPQVKPGNVSIYAFTDSYGALARTKQLARENSIAVSVDESRDEFIAVFVAIMAVVFSLSIVLLFLDIRIKPTSLQHLLPATRLLWIIALAIPLATFIMFLQLPSFTTAEIAFDYFSFAAMEIAFICIIVALVFRWTYALFTMLGLTILVLVADQLLGGPMTATGYLSYSPMGATRYYGMGNEGASLLFGSWVTLSALLLNQVKRERFLRIFKHWIFPLGSLFIFAVIAAPWWGSNFGVIIWGTVGLIIAASMFKGRHFSWMMVVCLTLIAALLAFIVLVLDTSFETESHLGTYASTLQSDAWWMVVPEVIRNMLSLSWNTITFSPALAVGFFIILGFMIMLRVRQPGGYRKFWEDNQAFASGYTALLVTAIIMLFVEDSGILMPALLLLYALAGLVWLVCSSHSWHIRRWVARRRMVMGD